MTAPQDALAALADLVACVDSGLNVDPRGYVGPHASKAWANARAVLSARESQDKGFNSLPEVSGTLDEVSAPDPKAQAQRCVTKAGDSRERPAIPESQPAGEADALTDDERDIVRDILERSEDDYDCDTETMLLDAFRAGKRAAEVGRLGRALHGARAYLSEPQQEDARDAARLDYAESKRATIYSSETHWVFVDETTGVRKGNLGNSIRAAIDAALAAKGEK